MWYFKLYVQVTVSEMPNMHMIEVDLKMRETKLGNGLLFNTEAWSSIKDAEYSHILTKGDTEVFF